ncbi:MAG: class I SAM-dependent methyltransferase [Dehalococcoidales bacterium]
MDNCSSLKKNKQYNEAAGLPKSVLSILDFHRFKRVKKHLYSKSILDIGPGRADFLKSIKSDYEISGIDMNMERVKYCNQILGQDAVKLGNLETGLDFEDGSFDTVTCLEVLEHLADPQKAIKELVRVSRKRVIITVPFDEEIQYVLCIHCAKYTPYSGHLHSFNQQTLKNIIPDNARIVKTELIGNKVSGIFPYLSSIVFSAPFFISSFIDGLANRIFPRATWLMVILDKHDSADNRR